jgi:hypothetical protein
MDETLQKIRAAYAQAGAPTAEYPPLPAWEALSLELREAFVSIYHRGRRDGILDEVARAIKAGGWRQMRVACWQILVLLADGGHDQDREEVWAGNKTRDGARWAFNATKPLLPTSGQQ